MTNLIQSIALDKLVAHPDNPNRMSSVNFAKLVRNIGRTSRYEPLVVRPAPESRDCFQIINGYHRWRALAKLGYSNEETNDIILYASGRKTLRQAPYINHESLTARGFGDEELKKVEAGL